MNPTAEDILNSKDKDGIRKYWIGVYGDERKIGVKDAIAAMEEYSLLKSKEAADKAWEAGYKRREEELYIVESRKTAPDKETFMKELF